MSRITTPISFLAAASGNALVRRALALGEGLGKIGAVAGVKLTVLNQEGMRFVLGIIDHHFLNGVVFAQKKSISDSAGLLEDAHRVVLFAAELIAVGQGQRDVVLGLDALALRTSLTLMVYCFSIM